jgi:hypothetical protein
VHHEALRRAARFIAGQPQTEDLAFYLARFCREN